MSKDPAFLFYTSDFLTGTMTMSNEQVGKYIRLLCLQHQKGILTEKDMLFICQLYDQDIFEKFIKDENGSYYNERLRIESEKRNKFTESRRQSRLKADEDNVRIYLLKDIDNGLIKIGSSVNPLRRYNEITNQTMSVSGSSENRNFKLIWYSEPILRKIENEIHDLFKDKRIEGEWFKLSNSDISKIKEVISETYKERTNNVRNTYDERTENENVNEIDNKNTNKKTKYLDSVFLTESEYKKLQEVLGQKSLDDAIEKLDYSITVKGGKYKDHYKTILNWNKRGFLNNNTEGEGNIAAWYKKKKAEEEKNETGRI